ncbi:MAG UNVERIFIED_CONTAM: hypothetical protein LVR18_30785 [Planctomycetaceae bacterium]
MPSDGSPLAKAPAKPLAEMVQMQPLRNSPSGEVRNATPGVLFTVLLSKGQSPGKRDRKCCCDKRYGNTDCHGSRAWTTSGQSQMHAVGVAGATACDGHGEFRE